MKCPECKGRMTVRASSYVGLDVAIYCGCKRCKRRYALYGKLDGSDGCTSRYNDMLRLKRYAKADMRKAIMYAKRTGLDVRSLL